MNMFHQRCTIIMMLTRYRLFSVYVSPFLNIVFCLCLGRELYYWCYKGTAKTIKKKVVCGDNEANKIFVDYHASPTGEQCDQTKTREIISRRFY